MSLVAVDPVTCAEAPIAESFDPARLDKVNGYLWNQLDRIVRKARDTRMIKEHGRLIGAEIYRAGFGALLQLTEGQDIDILPTAQGFCADRLSRAGEYGLIEVVSTSGDHIPIEVLPLMGKLSDPTGLDSQTIIELQTIMPGYAAVCRHGLANPDHSNIGVASNLNIRLFRHIGLRIAVLDQDRLQRLQRMGQLHLPLVFPPKNYRPPLLFPELDLARVVGSSETQQPERRQPDIPAVSHFSCHISPRPAGTSLILRSDGWKSRNGEYVLDQIGVAALHLQHLGPKPLLIFLNACHSGVVDPELYTSAVNAFRYFEPASIIGSLASVPDLIASELTKAFYEAMSKGSSIGISLLDSRRKILGSDFNNPLGLLFISYFGEDSYAMSRRDHQERFIPPSKYDSL
ncbi:MAG TPA: CHAT domain-containing protein [Dermatophilaceae bacterium]